MSGFLSTLEDNKYNYDPEKVVKGTFFKALDPLIVFMGNFNNEGHNEFIEYKNNIKNSNFISSLSDNDADNFINF